MPNKNAIGIAISNNKAVALFAASPITMQAVNALEIPEIKVRKVILRAGLFTCPPNVVEQIKRKIRPARKEESRGEMNQDATVIPNFYQLTPEAPQPARPAPTKAPITV